MTSVFRGGGGGDGLARHCRRRRRCACIALAFEESRTERLALGSNAALGAGLHAHQTRFISWISCDVCSKVLLHGLHHSSVFRLRRHICSRCFRCRRRWRSARALLAFEESRAVRLATGSTAALSAMLDALHQCVARCVFAPPFGLVVRRVCILARALVTADYVIPDVTALAVLPDAIALFVTTVFRGGGGGGSAPRSRGRHFQAVLRSRFARALLAFEESRAVRLATGSTAALSAMLDALRSRRSRFFRVYRLAVTDVLMAVVRAGVCGAGGRGVGGGV